MFSKTSVGIEINGSGLNIAVVASAAGKLRLVDSIALPEYSREAVERVVREHSIPTSRVFLALASGSGIVRQIEFPAEVRNDLESALALQVESLSPWGGDEIYWSYAEDAAVRGAAQLKATVAIAPRSALDEAMAFFASAGLPLSGACLLPQALAHGMTSLWSDGNPSMALSHHADAVEGVLTHSGHLFTVREPVTADGEASRRAAARLLALGRLASTEKLHLLMQGAAGAAELPGVAKLPLEGKPAAPDSFGAIAAALLGLRTTAFGSNLIPESRRHRRSRMQLVPVYALVGLVLLSMLALALREPWQNMVYAAQLDAAMAQLGAGVSEAGVREASLQQQAERAAALTGHFDSKDRNLEALNALTRILPAAAWLSNYSYQDGVVTISGFSDNPSAVQRLLDDDPLFTDVQFTAPVVRDASGKERFTIRAVVEVVP